MQKAIGIDIGGTHTKLGVIDQNGQITDFHRFDSPKTFSEWLHIVTPYIKNFQTQFEIKGIGIGAPNGNFIKGIIENPVNLAWGTVNLCHEVQSSFNLPVFVDNDANLSALAEKHFGEGKKSKNFFVVTLGTGLGSGIVVEGKVLRGYHGIAGEAGHMCLYPEGRICHCGGVGHLEAYVSVSGVEKTHFESHSEQKKFSDIFDLFQHNDPKAQLTVDITARHLALGLCQMINLFDPELIVVSGGMSNLGDKFISQIQFYLEPLLTLSHYRPLITISSLGKQYGAIQGAAVLLYENLA